MTRNTIGGYTQLVYWRIARPYLSLSLSTTELEAWVGQHYFRALWRSPETGRIKLWAVVGKWGQRAKFNADERAKFARANAITTREATT